MTLKKPLLPECFMHWTETAGRDGPDVLRLATWRRNLTLEGSSFQDFQKQVVPLLNGKKTVDEICDAVSETFRKADVVAALDMLAAQRIVVEADDYVSGDGTAVATPQLGWLHEVSPEGRSAQKRLSNAHVVLVGAGMQGAVAARGLVAAGIGKLTVVDPAPVSSADPYFSALFDQADAGRNRAAVLCDKLSDTTTTARVQSVSEIPSTAADLGRTLDGAGMVLCCLDPGELSLAFSVNTACRDLGIPWIASSLEGTEVVVGPGFFDPRHGACYQCWRTREITASARPEMRYAVEKHLAAAQRDLSEQRENLAPAADIAGGMLCAEVISLLCGASLPALDGRFFTIGVPGLLIEKHMVLRQPGCPACGPAPRSSS